jgi:hypothetical protein
MIEGEPVIRPDGTEAKRVVLLSDSAPASLTVTGADVPGMNADDVIATGSVLITPSANYIAFEDGVFTEKG